MGPHWQDIDGWEAVTVTPTTPWHRFADSRGLLESVRLNERIRQRIAEIDTVIADVRARVSELRTAPTTRELTTRFDDDELSGVVLYTHDNMTGDKEGQLYYEENKDLRLRDAQARMRMLKTWGTHVYYTLKAMGKLDDVIATTYRGLPDRETVGQQYKLGRPIQFGAWTSTARALESAKEYIEDAGANGVILKIQVQTGKDINAISMFPSEGEVLLTPSHRFVVTRELYEEGGYWYVDLVEEAGTRYVS